MIIVKLSNIQHVPRYIALCCMAFMMLFITVNVVFRLFNVPLIGSVEIVELLMIIVIMFGLAFSQERGAHISVQIIYDKLPKRIQKLLDLISFILSVGVTMVIAIIYFNIGVNSIQTNIRTTELLKIPLYPFEFLIALGFLLWFIQLIIAFVKRK